MAGVDEVGRGPLAGPVVAAAVILDPDGVPAGLDDSKRLTPAARTRLAAAIHETALCLCVVALPAEAIDASDIRSASLTAMVLAVEGLALAPGHALIDGRDVPPGLPCPATALVRGDARCVSIAAASIIAKVARDAMMARVAALHPGWGFECNAGYPSAAHRATLARDGPLPGLHRMTFRPVAQAARQRDT